MSDREVMRRLIRVHFDDGDTITTYITGTVDDIECHYLGKTFELSENRLARAERIEFLEIPKPGEETNKPSNGRFRI